MNAEGLLARHDIVVADATKLGVAELEFLAQEAGERLAEAPAIDILSWAALTFGRQLVVASSMADGVVAHLAARALPGVDVAFLDTGLHFAETIGTRDALEATLDIRVINAQPELTLAEQEQQFGAELWARDPDGCCRIRKVEPLARVLAPYRAWVTGIRREESTSRADTGVVEWDARRRMVKVNPIARWTRQETTLYADRHSILVNPLLRVGYESIGCAPCTRPVSRGEDGRAGRWAGNGKTECGLHT